MRFGGNMKILIIYGTKTGTTASCAEKIRELLVEHEVTVHNLEKNPKIHLADYDSVIIGTPLYMGQIRHKVNQFLIHNKKKLLEMKVHYFVTGLARGDEGVALFKKQIPSELFGQAVQIKQVGGDVHVEKLNFLYRWIMKKVMSESKPELGILEDEIKDLVLHI